MASSSSQSIQVGVSNDCHQKTKKQMEMRTMEEVPNRLPKGGVVSRRNMARRHWTRWEDFKLIKHIVVHGGGNWKTISDQLPGRTPESCKVRWSSTLNPLLKKPSFGRKEEEVISEEELGRTDVYVKIFYNALMAKKHTISSSASYKSVVSPERSDVNGPPSDDDNGVKCKRSGLGMGGVLANEETLINNDAHPSPSPSPSPLVFPSSMNLNPISNNTWQQPPSPPIFIDFMGVGSI